MIMVFYREDKSLSEERKKEKWKLITRKSFNEMVERVNLRLEELEESEYGCLMEGGNLDEMQFYNGMRCAYQYVNQIATILKKGKINFGS